MCVRTSGVVCVCVCACALGVRCFLTCHSSGLKSAIATFLHVSVNPAQHGTQSQGGFKKHVSLRLDK